MILVQVFGRPDEYEDSSAAGVGISSNSGGSMFVVIDNVNYDL